jgi:hypothetical protein
MRTSVLILFLAAASILAGCNAPRPDALPADLDQINLILDDSSLSAQQKRAALEDLGLDPVIINGLLHSQRTGNQFGGDLRSAYEKVTADALDQLTPDEVQIYGDAAEPLAEGDSNFTFTDAQAQEIVNFFGTHGIASSTDLATVLDDPAQAAGLPADITSAALIGLFVDFDPQLLLPDLP